MDREYYVIQVKVATGATKYLVVFEHETADLVVYDKCSDEGHALALADSLNRLRP